MRHCLNNQCNDRKHCMFVFISRPYEQVCCNKKAIWMNIGERGCILSLAWKQDTDTAASTAFLAYGSHSRPKHITSKHMHTTSICLTWLPRQSRGWNPTCYTWALHLFKDHRFLSLFLLMKTIISPPPISVPLADLVHNSSAEDTQPVLFTSKVRVCFIILLKIHSSHAVVSAMPVLTALSLPQHGKMSGTRHKNYSMVSHGDVFAWLHCSNRLMTPI